MSCCVNVQGSGYHPRDSEGTLRQPLIHDFVCVSLLGLAMLQVRMIGDSLILRPEPRPKRSPQHIQLLGSRIVVVQASHDSLLFVLTFRIFQDIIFICRTRWTTLAETTQTDTMTSTTTDRPNHHFSFASIGDTDVQ